VAEPEIRIKYSADRQWFVRICAAVRARAFLALSMDDFLGGGGGIVRVPWLGGSSFHALPGCSEFLRHLELQVSQRSNPGPGRLLGGLACQLVCSLVARDTGVLFDPPEFGCLETRLHTVSRVKFELFRP